MNSDVDLNLINPGEFDAWMQGGLTKTSPTNLPEGHFTVLAHGAGGVVVYDHRPITEGTYEIATL
ncbi:MAG: hypothetical protein MUF77_05270, partial [Leptospira sp.]|nr:hypothetical protein [Leptospira sp.]